MPGATVKVGLKVLTQAGLSRPDAFAFIEACCQSLMRGTHDDDAGQQWALQVMMAARSRRALEGERQQSHR